MRLRKTRPIRIPSMENKTTSNLILEGKKELKHVTVKLKHVSERLKGIDKRACKSARK
jgi:hypothetical protein